MNISATAPCGWASAPRAVQLLLLALGLVLAGCERSEPLHLLELRAITPGIFEAGAEIAVLGDGFPERRTGSLVFVGTASVPGRAASDVRARVAVVAESAGRASRVLTNADLEGLTGGARHATFRGTIRLEFEPVRAGVLALVAEKRGVVIDVFAPGDGDVASRALDIGEREVALRFASHLGLELGEGFVVLRTLPGSEAEQAGLAPGMRLLALDGVHLERQSDFVPAPHAGLSTLDVEDVEGLRSSIQVARSGFRSGDPAVSLGAVLGLVLAVVLAVVLARPPRIVGFGAAVRARPARLTVARTAPTTTRVAALVAVPFWLVTRSPLEVPFELPLFVALGVAALFEAALLDGWRCAQNRESPALRVIAPRKLPVAVRALSALRALALAALAALPVLAAFGQAALETGSLRRVDFAGPGQVLLWASPWGLGLALVGLLGLVVERAEDSRRRSLSAVLSRFGTAVLLLVWIEMQLGHLGGFEARSTAHGVLLVGLSVLLAWLLDGTRAWLGHPRSSSATGSLVLPLAAISLVLSGATFALDVGQVLRGPVPALRPVTLALFVILLALVPLVLLRSARGRGRTLDPWL